MSLSGRTKTILQGALADRVAGNEVAAAIDSNAWSTTAKEIAAAAHASAAFVAQLQVGDIVEVVDHTAGTTTFALVTTAGTNPLSVTTGDLCICDRKAAVQYKGIVFPTDGSGYKDTDPVNYVPAEVDHKKFPAS